LRFSFFAAGSEHLECAVVGTLEVGLVTIEGGEGPGLVQGAEGEGGAGILVADFELFVDGGFLAGGFEVEEGGFDGCGAVQAPIGGDELADEAELGGGLRLKLGEVGVAEGAELVLGLGFEDDGAGGEAVGDGGGLTAGETLGGGRSVRECAVGA
jgi:hypothetical protein